MSMSVTVLTCAKEEDASTPPAPTIASAIGDTKESGEGTVKMLMSASSLRPALEMPALILLVHMSVSDVQKATDQVVENVSMKTSALMLGSAFTDSV